MWKGLKKTVGAFVDEIAKDDEEREFGIKTPRIQKQEIGTPVTSRDSSLIETINDLEEQLKQLKIENHVMREQQQTESSHYERTLRGYENDINDKEYEINQLKAMINTLELRAKRVKEKESSELSNTHINSVTEDELKQTIVGLEKENENQKTKIFNLTDSCDSLRNELSDLRNQIKTLNQEKKTSDNSTDELFFLKAELDNVLEENRQLKQIIQDMKGADDNNQLQTEIRNSNNEIDRLSELLDTTLNEKVLIQQELDETNVEIEELTTELNKLQISLETVKDRPISGTLCINSSEDNVSESICKKCEKLTEELEQLKKEHENSSDEQNKVIDNLEKEISRLNKEYDSNFGETKEHINNLQSKLDETNENEKKLKEILEDLTKQNTSMKEEIFKLNEDLDSIRKQQIEVKTQYNEELAAKETSLQTFHSLLEEKTKTINELELDQQAYRKQIQQMSESRSQMLKQIDELQHEIVENEKIIFGVPALQEEISTLQKKIKQSDNQIKKLNEKLANERDLSSQLKDLKANHKETEEEKIALMEELKKLSEQNKLQFAETIKQFEDEICKLNQKKSLAESKISIISEESRAKSKTIDSLNKTIEELSDSLTSKDQQLRFKERALEQKTFEVSNNVRLISDYRTRIESLQKELVEVKQNNVDINEELEKINQLTQNQTLKPVVSSLVIKFLKEILKRYQELYRLSISSTGIDMTGGDMLPQSFVTLLETLHKIMLEQKEIEDQREAIDFIKENLGELLTLNPPLLRISFIDKAFMGDLFYKYVQDSSQRKKTLSLICQVLDYSQDVCDQLGVGKKRFLGGIVNTFVKTPKR
eukprot:TRINITY_DN2760_c1_g1_i1.p1 TRINITY_DN2760_c1_g1~~TRINITY_DN2760_c1_g1_i1.p1  ORF type:complete len:827 (+),score=293.31 TRINITY_DN2760_c1_g1_i1:56-2536(+)